MFVIVCQQLFLHHHDHQPSLSFLPVPVSVSSSRVSLDIISRRQPKVNKNLYILFAKIISTTRYCSPGAYKPQFNHQKTKAESSVLNYFHIAIAEFPTDIPHPITTLPGFCRWPPLLQTQIPAIPATVPLINPANFPPSI